MGKSNSEASLSNKHRVWLVLARGESLNSPKAKAIRGVKYSSKRKYQSEWRAAGRPTEEMILKMAAETRMNEHQPVAATALPGGESVQIISEKSISQEMDQDPELMPALEDEPEEEMSPEPDDEVELLPQADNPAPPGHDGEESEDEGEEIEIASNGKNKKETQAVSATSLRVTVEISVKTLMLYHIAATKHRESGEEGELTLGDFIDACAEDTYVGRGLDLGLVSIGGNNRG